MSSRFVLWGGGDGGVGELLLPPRGATRAAGPKLPLLLPSPLPPCLPLIWGTSSVVPLRCCRRRASGQRRSTGCLWRLHGRTAWATSGGCLPPTSQTAWATSALPTTGVCGLSVLWVGGRSMASDGKEAMATDLLQGDVPPAVHHLLNTSIARPRLLPMHPMQGRDRPAGPGAGQAVQDDAGRQSGVCRVTERRGLQMRQVVGGGRTHLSALLPTSPTTHPPAEPVY